MTDLDITPSPRLEAFLEALPSADADAFVTPPGLGGGWKARHIRRGLERGVLAVHWTGMGLCLVQPEKHGVCPHCAASKSRSICDHCACTLCSWLRWSEERQSPPVPRERLLQLLARLKGLQFGQSTRSGALDEDLA